MTASSEILANWRREARRCRRTRPLALAAPLRAEQTSMWQVVRKMGPLRGEGRDSSSGQAGRGATGGGRGGGPPARTLRQPPAQPQGPSACRGCSPELVDAEQIFVGHDHSNVGRVPSTDDCQRDQRLGCCRCRVRRARPRRARPGRRRPGRPHPRCTSLHCGRMPRRRPCIIQQEQVRWLSKRRRRVRRRW